MRRPKLTLAVIASACCFATTAFGDDDPHAVHAKHVLLISVDGMHQADLDWFVSKYPNSRLAKLVHQGVEYTNARTPFPSDSFPGMVGQVTGGDPKTTGIYYDDEYSRSLLPQGTTMAACASTKPGAEVFYAEVIAKDPNRLDSGQNIPGLYTDFSKIFQLFGDPAGVASLINTASLPVTPSPSCKPVYPHDYLKVNTVFGVLHNHQLRTAWSDKHIAYEILNGPSGSPAGTSIDDLFAPEINSSVTDPTPPAQPGPDWTKDNTSTQKYDDFKAQAVVNWIHGHDHAGNGSFAIPAIYGMNFQAVSTAQKLNKSNYYKDPLDPSTIVPNGLGGYTNDGTVPGVVLQSSLTFVDEELEKMISDKAFDPQNTVVIVSAKHGQSPRNREDLTIIDDGALNDALNSAWASQHPGGLPLIAHSIDDDGILMWLNDRSDKAIDFARNFLLSYSGTGVGSHEDGSSFPKPFTQAGTRKIYAGEEAADFVGVPKFDDRYPDIIGIAQHGSVYAGKSLSKIAEHGGDARDDRHVPLVVWGAGIRNNIIDSPVQTKQIAPTILQLLGYNPRELDAVRIEDTPVLPHLR